MRPSLNKDLNVDYFSDPRNKDKNREDAIEAWNAIKVLPGSNKYKG